MSDTIYDAMTKSDAWQQYKLAVEPHQEARKNAVYAAYAKYLEDIKPAEAAYAKAKQEAYEVYKVATADEMAKYEATISAILGRPVQGRASQQ